MERMGSIFLRGLRCSNLGAPCYDCGNIGLFSGIGLRSKRLIRFESFYGLDTKVSILSMKNKQKSLSASFSRADVFWLYVFCGM